MLTNNYNKRDPTNSNSDQETNNSKMMNRVLQVAVLLALIGCMSCGIITGGLSDEKQPDERVYELVNRFHNEFEGMSNDKFESIEPVAYKMQIVSGHMYYVKVVATGKDNSKTIYHLKIYSPPARFGELEELVGFKSGCTLFEEIKYF